MKGVRKLKWMTAPGVVGLGVLHGTLSSWRFNHGLEYPVCQDCNDLLVGDILVPPADSHWRMESLHCRRTAQMDFQLLLSH